MRLPVRSEGVSGSPERVSRRRRESNFDQRSTDGDVRSEPGLHLRFHPSDTLWTQLHAHGKVALRLQRHDDARRSKAEPDCLQPREVGSLC